MSDVFTGIVEELGTDHVRTARAKGLPGRAVLRRHAAPMTYLAVADEVRLGGRGPI